MAADPAVAAELAKIDLFSSLSKKALKRVASQSKLVHHPAGKHIADEGERGLGFHLITEGTASVRVGERARPDLGPGDYFGEISMIDGQPRSATVTASSALTTISIAAWDFKPILAEEPEVVLRTIVPVPPAELEESK